jgi:hypothetical protein
MSATTNCCVLALLASTQNATIPSHHLEHARMLPPVPSIEVLLPWAEKKRAVACLLLAQN